MHLKIYKYEELIIFLIFATCSINCKSSNTTNNPKILKKKIEKKHYQKNLKQNNDNVNRNNVELAKEHVKINTNTYKGIPIWSCIEKEKIEFYKKYAKVIKGPIESKKNKRIYQGKKLNIKFNFVNGDEIFLETKDGEKISALLFEKKNSDKIVLYFHGNNSNLEDMSRYINVIIPNKNINVMCIDYRGYGKSSGKSVENGLYLDAQAAYDYLVKEKKYRPNNIIVVGRSLGSGVAVETAKNNIINSMILISPYHSIKENAIQQQSGLTKIILKRTYGKTNEFDNLNKIIKIKVPTLIITGKEDKLFNHKDNAEKLYKNSGAIDKKLILLDYVGHPDIIGCKEYKESINKFLTKRLLST